MNKYSAREIAQTLTHYLSQEILEQTEPVNGEENLLMELGVDSLGMLRLVGFIESYYNLTISPIYFTIENFRNINVITSFVTNLLNENG